VKPVPSLAVALLASLLAPLATPVVAQQPSPFTTQDLFKLRAVGSAVISPDGSTIAYTLLVPRDPMSGKDGPGYSELHVVGPDGRSRPFITGEGTVGDVQFLADGKSIAFVAKRGNDKNKSLYAIPVEGGEARKLLEADADLAAFAIHPTLKRVAYLVTPPNKTKKEAVDKGFSQEVFEEDWTAAQLFIADFDGPTAKPKPVPLKGHPSDLRWSPDGKNLLLALAPDPLVDSSYMRKKLQVIDSQTGSVVTAIDHQGKLGGSTMSPSGGLVALIAAQDEHDPQPGRLTVASAYGGITKELLPDFPGHFVSCVFANEQSLLYVADRGCETVVGRIGADGSGNQELIAQPGFVVSSLSLSKDGKKAALVVQTPTQPPELYRWDVGGAPTRVTTSNPWLAERKLAAQEVFDFKARDGLALEGVLIHPLDHAPGAAPAKPYPLVMIVHGGPESHVRDGWVTRYSEPGQVLAAKGYAVLYPNYRASTGRGVEFSKLDHKDPAGKEFDDLVDAIDALVASGLVDKAKVGVTGGSYGGYASGWCATKLTDRFAAAVMGFGVADLLSMIGTSDIPDEHYLVHHEVHPWEDWQLFLDRSPIFHAKDSKTPLLILAGKADPRVPPSQSMELYRYLEITGHPSTRLVLYPGEGHGNARAASRLDYHLRLLQWFDHYLMGPGGTPPPQELDYKTMFEAGKPANAAAPAGTATGGSRS
jgi:dipeptidyl aminopeptidase/acylaminoacyl peptidase